MSTLVCRTHEKKPTTLLSSVSGKNGRLGLIQICITHNIYFYFTLYLSQERHEQYFCEIVTWFGHVTISHVIFLYYRWCLPYFSKISSVGNSIQGPAESICLMNLCKALISPLMRESYNKCWCKFANREWDWHLNLWVQIIDDPIISFFTAQTSLKHFTKNTVMFFCSIISCTSWRYRLLRLAISW